MAADPSKIEKVATWPTPTSVRETQQFLGFAGYYRRFVQDFAHIARPLHRLTERPAIFMWTDECQGSFDELRRVLTSAPVLAYPDFNRAVHPRHGRQRHWQRCCPLAGRRRRSGTSHRLRESPTDKARETVLRHTPGAVGRCVVREAVPPLSDGPAIPAAYRPWIPHLAAQLPRARGSTGTMAGKVAGAGL